MPNPAGWSALLVSWGQFLDHDLSLTRDASGEFISVSGLAGPFQRSLYDGGTGTGDPRQPVNEITPQLDASMVYGSTDARTNLLRSFSNGQLRTSEDPNSEYGLLPLIEEGDVMAGAHPGSGPLFLAGDVRANENIGLTTLQTLLVREHNHWADQLSQQHANWSDAQLFEAARSIVEAEIQNITYRDWLPTFLAGNEGLAPVAAVLAPSTGYDPSANGQVSVEFSTAAFRVGHTMVASEVPLMGADGQSDPNEALSVMQAFFNAAPLLSGNMDAILRSQAGTTAQAVDTKVIDDLNFFLVNGDGVSGFSLAALNILRGRDHGLDSYLESRAAVIGDIDPNAIAANDFSAITSDPGLQAQLAQVYDSVHDVGLWVGGLAEDRADGAQLGPLFAWIVADQFLRTRMADDTFGQLSNLLGADIAAQVADTGLRDIILRNSDLDYLQPDPFLQSIRSMGDDGANVLTGHAGSDMIMGMGGTDDLSGGWGHDMLYGGSGDDLVSGGGGTDMLEGNNGNDTITGGNGNDLLLGGADMDELRGNHGRDTLEGGNQDDTLLGGGGADSLIGGSGDDALKGGAGHDRMYGGSGDDDLMGNNGYDLLSGAGGEDHLAGGRGQDTLDGGADNDVLMGGQGADTFRFAGQFGNDLIKDFDPTQAGEVIDLSRVAGITDMTDLVDNHMDGTSMGTLIRDGAGNAIRIDGVMLSDLDASDFLF
jgi:peroxidase